MIDTPRFSAMVLALSLVAAACSSGGGDEASSAAEEPAGVTVTSDDGVLRVFVPDGAGPSEITVEKLDTLPETAVAGTEVEDVLSDPDSDLASLGAYSLGPDGSTFDEPVTIEWRTDFETDGSELPLAAALITTPDGDGVEPLDDIEVVADGGVAVVRGTTTHFSAVEAFDLYGARASARVDVEELSLVGDDRAFLRPPSIRQQVGESTAVKVELTSEDSRVTFGSVRFDASPNLTVAGRGDVQADVGCAAVGTGTYSAEVPYEFVIVGYRTFNAATELVGRAECDEAAGGGGDEDAVAAAEGLRHLDLALQCYDDATAPCSPVTWNDITPRVGVSLDDLPGGAATLSVRYSAEPFLPGGATLESRAFGTIANWVVIDHNGNPVGEPGPDIAADLTVPSLEFDLSEVVAYVETIIGEPLRSLTPVEVIYSDADGKAGGGILDDTAQREGRDWITELIETLGE